MIEERLRVPRTLSEIDAIREHIERAAAANDGDRPFDRAETERVIGTLFDALERGEVRAAERDSNGRWRAIEWVKTGMLLAYRVSDMVEMGHVDGGAFRFFDRRLFLPRDLSLADGIRIVPGGSIVRRGAYVAPGVICMPPMLVNLGAHIGTGTTIDSHALVGSCAPALRCTRSPTCAQEPTSACESIVVPVPM